MGRTEMLRCKIQMRRIFRDDWKVFNVPFYCESFRSVDFYARFAAFNSQNLNKTRYINLLLVPKTADEYKIEIQLSFFKYSQNSSHDFFYFLSVFGIFRLFKFMLQPSFFLTSQRIQSHSLENQKTSLIKADTIAEGAFFNHFSFGKKCIGKSFPITHSK